MGSAGDFLVCLTCCFATVLANPHRIKESVTAHVEVPLLLDGAYASGEVLRVVNQTTLYIAAFNQDFVLDIQKSRKHTVLASTVETTYKAIDEPFRRKTPFSDDCFYHGSIRGRRKSAVFLDACADNIRGTVYNGREKYIITSSTIGGPLHRIARLTPFDEQRHESRQDPRGKGTSRRRKRQTRQVTQPSSGGSLSKNYLELYIVHDYQQFVNSGRDLGSLRNKSATLAHLIAEIYQHIKIKVTLVGSEVWNKGDEISVSSNVYETLDRFLAWREEELLPWQPHDFALLVSGTTFMHQMKSHTYHGEMCSQSFSAAILEDYTEDVVQVANDAAHSLGHNLGLRHDTPECECHDPTGYCIMDIVKRMQPPTKFSTCSREVLASHLAMGRLTCLNNRPAIPRGPLCGNGLLEEGEQCDCGEPHECSDVCCISTECQMRADCAKRSSQTLAAAQVVTAPRGATATERQVAPASADISYQMIAEQQINPPVQTVNEEAEERFNAIDTDGVLAISDSKPLATVGVVLPTVGATRVGEKEVLDEFTVLDGARRPVVATREAISETTLRLQRQAGALDATVEAPVTRQQQYDGGTLSTDTSQAIGRATGDPSGTLPVGEDDTEGESRLSPAACGGTLPGESSTDSTILGDQVGMEEILERLGIVEPNDQPTFVIEPEPQLFVVSGKDLELHCEASGQSVISYIWLKDGEEIDILSDPRMRLHRGNLTIQYPGPRDIGIYQCLVSNIYTTAVSAKSSVIRAAMGRFSASPGTIREVYVGDHVILTCNPPISVPPPLVSWALNSSGEPIRYSRRTAQDPRGNLVIATVEEHDTGLYHCIVVNEVVGMKIESPRINLIVRRPAQAPVLVHSPDEHQMGLERQPLSLKCLAVGNPVPQIWWEREGAELPFNRSSHTSFGQELIISQLEAGDRGVYRCVASNGVGERVEASVTLTVKAAPSWARQPQSLTVPVGACASFTCEANGDPTPTITWLINNQPADELGHSLQLDITEEEGRSTLQMNHTTDVDSSSAVQCVASNRYGSIISNAHLTVLAMAAMFSETPPTELEVLEGESVSIPCRGLGAPRPTITWMKDRSEKYVSGNGLQIHADGSLTICNARASDERDYQCVVDNKYGYKTSSTRVSVRNKTQITVPPEDARVVVGDSLVLTCVVTPDRNLEVSTTWLTPGGRRISVEEGGDGSLRIDQVSLDDHGVYTCIAETSLDRVAASASVVVEEPPPPLLCGNAILDLDEDCDPGPFDASDPDPCCGNDCHWRRDVQCREDSACCQDCQLLPASTLCESAPGECKLPSFCTGFEPACPTPLPSQDGVPCGDGGVCSAGRCLSLCEAFGLSSCNCTAEENSCLHCCIDDGSCKPYSTPQNGAVSPLPNDVPCGLTGTCSQGVCVGDVRPVVELLATATAATAAASTATMTTERETTESYIERTPGAPSEVVMTSLSSPFDVQLSWSMGPDGRAGHFDVEARTSYSRGNWSLLATVPGNRTVARVKLYPYMMYHFRVTAVNGMGRSEPQETSGQYFTPPARPVSNPRNVTAAFKDGQVVIQWQPVRLEEHSAPLFFYNVQWRPLGSETWNTETVPPFKPSFAIPDSTENGRYEATVQAANAVGPGPQATWITYGAAVLAEATTTPTQPYVRIVVRPPETMQVIVGSQLSLPCRAEGSPTPRIEWYFNGEQIQEKNQLIVKGSGLLVVDPADLSNTGIYECRAINEVSREIQTAESDVSVVAPMLAFTSSPPASTNILGGQRLELPCEAAGFPQASVSWRFKRQEIDYGADIYMAQNSSLIIPVAVPAHSGLYQCIISNGLHNVRTADSRVNVREPLQVSVEPKEVVTVPGSDMTLPCTIAHDLPLTRVYWSLGDVLVYENRINQTSEDYSLLIEDVVREDGGVYVCAAETVLDSDSDSTKLIIQTPSDPPSGLTTSASTEPTRVSVSFDAPFDGNSPITAYIIEYSSPEAEVPWRVARNVTPNDSASVEAEITLPPFFGYYVRVRAANEFGLSEPSEVSGPLHLESTPPLRNPSGVETVVVNGGSQINVTWEPLRKSELNGPGFYYIVDWRGANQRSVQMLTLVDFRQSGVSLDVDPTLLPYEIMIQAGNDIGLGPIPAIVTAGIEERGLAIPDAPTNVKVDVISSTSVNVTWTPVPQRPSYGTVYGYRVVVRASDGTSDARPLNCLSTTTSCEIHGLHGGTAYSVTVIASGDGGEGYSSMPVAVSVLPDLPSTVQKLKVRAWSRTMLIKWNPPDGGNLNGYVVSYEPLADEGQTLEVVLKDPFATSLKIGSLAPGVSYRVSVAAFNGAGRGETLSLTLRTKSLKTKRSHGL